MIGIAGSRADPVLLHFATRCAAHDVPFADLDLGEAARRGEWDLRLPVSTRDRVSGSEEVHLAELTGVYVRAIYLGTTEAERVRWTGLVEGFTAWLEETPIPVVNRPGCHQLNSSKPAHYAWLAAHGLAVPPSLVSTEPDQVAAFVAAGRTVVKPVSGVRATTREVVAEDVARIDPDGAPVLVQRLVLGDDVRAHVVDDRVIATRYRSEAIDYRKDRRAERGSTEVPDELAELLVALTAEQGLRFAGWDFKVDRDETWWALECNPMPGYSSYDQVCGYRVSDALVDVLQNGGTRLADLLSSDM